MPSPLSVCYFGTYRNNYSRNQIMIEGLRRNGVVVGECQETLWHSIDDRVNIASGGWRRPSFFFRCIMIYLRLLKKFLLFKDYDLILIGYPGQLDVFLAYLLARVTKKPLVWDIFMSIYLVALERRLGETSPSSLRLLGWMEKKACRLPDLLILDTSEYVHWFEATHTVPEGKFKLVPTGADDRLFKPRHPEKTQPDKIHILYYGTFIPNHGVEYIIAAARRLTGTNKIFFELIGDGPEKEKALNLAQQQQLNNISFVNWLSQNDLIKKIAEADICLGVFGKTPQSLMTIQNKIYECLAMAKPVITGESDTVRGQFVDREEILLCPRTDGPALADAIQLLSEDPALRRKIAQNGFDKFKRHYSVSQIGSIYKKHLLDLLVNYSR